MRLHSLLCLLFALVLLLSACSGGTGGAPAPGEGGGSFPAEPAEEETVPKGAVSVTFWYAASGGGASAMEKIVSDFNAAQRTYYVKATVFGSYTEIYSAVQQALSDGTTPDVVVLERDVSIDLKNKGLTVELTDLLQQDPDGSPDRFLPVYYSQGVDEDGRLFAMPFYGTTQVLYYNKKAFAAAGIDPESLTTWQALAEAARKLRDQGVCDYGWEPMWGYENLLDAAFSNGGALLSEDGRTVIVNSPEWVEVWEAFRTWLHEDRIMRIHSGGYGWEYWYHTIDDVLSGTAGGYTGSSGDQADVDFDVVGILEQPAWDEAHAAAPEAKALLLNVMVTSGQEQREGACALIRYLVDVPAQVKWTTATGYIAVNRDVMRDPDYQAYIARNQYAQVPLDQSMHAVVLPNDPTGGAIWQALRLAADRVEIEGISARDALDEAQRTAQQALDEVLAGRGNEGALP